MTHEQLQGMIEGAMKKAADLGVAISVAIVDDHGELLAFERMDDALKISPEFAMTKAYTSSMLRMPTTDLAGYAVEGKPYFGLNTLFAGKLTTIAGGVPIMVNNQVVGGIGVGGSTDVSQDHACALEALKAL